MDRKITIQKLMEMEIVKYSPKGMPMALKRLFLS